MNIILTGTPGIGKTTIVEEVARALGSAAGGVLTREIRESGRRTGFAIESLDGRRAVLATRGRGPGPRVGGYRVLVANLERIGVRSLEQALTDKSVIIIDEIGKMELTSPAFRAMIIKALDSGIPTLSTLGVSKNAFFETIRNRPDVYLIEAKLGNRNELSGRILNLLTEE